MEAEQPKPVQRWRPRFSLLSALLLMTIVGMGIVVVLLWREVGPLRAENKRLRNELGYLTVDNPQKAYAIQLPRFLDDTWKWRIYLPPGGTHALRCYSGIIPPAATYRGNDWFKAVEQTGSGMSTTGGLEGEFTLEAKLAKEDGEWKMYTRIGSGFSGKSSIRKFKEDWLSDTRSRSSTSGVNVGTQRTIEPGQPFLLLHLPKMIVTTTAGGGYDVQLPTVPAEGVVLWIEQSQPPPPRTGPGND